VSFSDVLYGVVQGKSGSYRAPRTEKERGHKAIQFWSLASVLPTVNRRQQNQKDIYDRDEIRDGHA